MDDYSAFAAYQHSTAIAHTDDIGEIKTFTLDLGVRLGGLYDALGTWPAFFSWTAHMVLDLFFFFLSFVDTLWILHFSHLSSALKVMCN